MADDIHDSMTVEEIMERIRERVRARGPAAETSVIPTAPAAAMMRSPANSGLYDLSEMQHEVATNNMLWNAVGTINPRPRGLHNDLIQVAKKVIGRLLSWYTRPLHAFNGSVARSLSHTLNTLDNFRAHLSAVGPRLENLEASQRELVTSLQQRLTRLDEALAAERELTAERHAALESQLGQHQQQAIQEFAQLCAQLAQLAPLALLEPLRQQLDTLASQMHKFEDDGLYERLRLSERNVRRLVHLLEERSQPQLAASSPQLLEVSASVVPAEPEFDYFWFEERFRGSETEIKERQRIYLEYFRGRQNVLDLGCGRGEFLELLRENGVSGRGVDLNTDMVLLCQEKGLDVVQEDLFSYLESLPDESLGGVFCAQVIEHLPTGQQLRLVNLAKLKLMPGSPLVIETINPECLFALARNFFLDPTHVRPVHPEMLRFLLQSVGFQKIELKFSAPVDLGRRLPKLALPQPPPELDRFNEALEHVNSILFGFQDYAAAAIR